MTIQKVKQFEIIKSHSVSHKILLSDRGYSRINNEMAHFLESLDEWVDTGELSSLERKKLEEMGILRENVSQLSFANELMQRSRPELVFIYDQDYIREPFANWSVSKGLHSRAVSVDKAMQIFDRDDNKNLNMYILLQHGYCREAVLNIYRRLSPNDLFLNFFVLGKTLFSDNLYQLHRGIACHFCGQKNLKYRTTESNESIESPLNLFSILSFGSMEKIGIFQLNEYERSILLYRFINEIERNTFFSVDKIATDFLERSSTDLTTGQCTRDIALSSANCIHHSHFKDIG